MAVLTGLLATTGGVAVLALFPAALAADWVHSYRLPAGERGVALYTAISGTIGLVACIVVLSITVPGGFFAAARGFYGLGYEGALPFRLFIIALFLATLGLLVNELWLLTDATEEQTEQADGEAQAARRYDRPQGSDGTQ